MRLEGFWVWGFGGFWVVEAVNVGCSGGMDVMFVVVVMVKMKCWEKRQLSDCGGRKGEMSIDLNGLNV